MKIEFTNEQFKNLLKVVYLGNWMANAIHAGNEEDPRHKGLEEIENYINSFAEKFGFGDYVDYDKKCKQYFLSGKIYDLVDEYIDDYDSECFWLQLHYRLSGRDFERKYTDKEISKMNQEERFKKGWPFHEKWENELNDHGIKRLEIKK